MSGAAGGSGWPGWVACLSGVRRRGGGGFGLPTSDSALVLENRRVRACVSPLESAVFRYPALGRPMCYGMCRAVAPSLPPARERGRKQGTWEPWDVVCVKSLEKLVIDVFLVVDYESDLKNRCSPGRF